MNKIISGLVLALALTATPPTTDKIFSPVVNSTKTIKLSKDANVFTTNTTNIRILPGDSSDQRDHNSSNTLNNRIVLLDKRSVLSREGRSNSRDEGLQLCLFKWSPEECSDLDFIIGHESGWVVGRLNSEGCGGLAQACPKSKLGEAYGNLEGELQWAYNYAIARYGSVAAAKDEWQRKRWW